MRLPDFVIAQIEDPYIRRNFEILRDYLKLESHLQGFKFYTITFTGAATDFEFAHDLGYQPADLIETSVTNGAVVTWDYSGFTSSILKLSVDKECVIRLFAGTVDQSK